MISSSLVSIWTLLYFSFHLKGVISVKRSTVQREPRLSSLKPEIIKVKAFMLSRFWTVNNNGALNRLSYINRIWSRVHSRTTFIKAFSEYQFFHISNFRYDECGKKKTGVCHGRISASEIFCAEMIFVAAECSSCITERDAYEAMSDVQHRWIFGHILYPVFPRSFTADMF